MIGVVMEEEQLLDLGKERQRDDIIHATVSPTNVRLVFGIVVLGVDDQHVRLLQEFDHFLVLIAGIFERFQVV